jgi:subtilisin
MSRRAILLVTVMAAALLAGTGALLAQETEKRTKPSTSPQQPAESNVIPGRYIVVLKDDGAGQAGAEARGQKREAQQVANDLSQENKVQDITHTYGAALKGFAAAIPPGKVGAVRSAPRVAFVAEDREVHAMAQTLPTGVNRVDADLNTNSVDAGNGSGAVNVDIAILDSGIYTKHPDLTIAGGKDCSTDGKDTFSDDNGHGSHVAGSAAAEDNTTGVVGTAPGARLWSVKVLDSQGRGSISSVICGIDWVTDNASTIEVASMSLAAKVGPGADDNNCGLTIFDAVHQAICRSVAAGVPYVVAAGSDGFVGDVVTKYIPASYNEVITVSALADYNGLPNGGAPRTCKQDFATDDEFAFFSNFGRDVDIGAPGVCIKSTWKGIKKGRRGHRRIVPGYKTISGTSMASAHVAGAAAVYLANTKPSATPAQVKTFVTAAANTEAKGSGHFDTIGLRPHPEPVLQMDNY